MEQENYGATYTVISAQWSEKIHIKQVDMHLSHNARTIGCQQGAQSHVVGDIRHTRKRFRFTRARPATSGNIYTETKQYRICLRYHTFHIDR